MSRTTRSQPRRPLVVAGLVLIGLAASAATTPAQSPSPEAALLNRIPAATYPVVAARNQSPTAVDGDRALLNRSVAAPCAPIVATRRQGEVRPVDGEQPLLSHGAFRLAGGIGRERGRSSDLERDLKSELTSAYFAAFTGVGAEGRDMVWRGAVAGAAVGELIVRLAPEGRVVNTARPEWPVEGIIFVTGEDPRRAFSAEVRGTIDWRRKRLTLAGEVTVGYLRGAHVEQTADLINRDLSGELRLAPATLAATR